MKRQLVATLLCVAASGTSAKAALVYEFTGPVTTSHYHLPDFPYPATPAFQFTTEGSLIGKCSPPYCSDTITATGVKWTGGYPGQTYLDFIFTFDSPIATPAADGAYAGKGSGFYLTGDGLGTQYTRYDLNFTQLRLFDDDVLESVEDWFRIAAPTPAPEPASWALMIGGFALTGAAMRRRRTSVVAFA